MIYTVSVEYFTLTGGIATGDLFGSGLDQVLDTEIDHDLGAVQDLLTAQISPGAVLLKVDRIKLGATNGSLLSQSDVLLVRDGDVVVWADGTVGPAVRLHASTTAAANLPHPFTFSIVAKGTVSPSVSFDFTITASGEEKYFQAAHFEKAIELPYDNPKAAVCRSLPGGACLDPGCTLTSANLVDYNSSSQLERTFAVDGDRCVSFKITISSTSFWNKDCAGHSTGCGWCGSWYSGRAVLDGKCPQFRSWTRTASGNGTAQVSPALDFTTDYVTAGGSLGSGAADTAGISGQPSYMGAVANCQAGGAAVSCDCVHPGMQGSTLRVAADCRQPVQETHAGSGALSSPQGIHLFGAFPFSAANNGDIQYSLAVTFNGKTYQDGNGDHIVDVGPFSLWIGGTSGTELWGAFDRSSVPTAFIDSISPNPALLGEPVSFAGHGAGAFSGFEWLTNHPSHLLSNLASFTTNTLQAGQHQISFRVLGSQPSPFVFEQVTVNQPPVAFINHIENLNDPAHPTVALQLRDGVVSDPFRFDGSGIDVDGSVVAWEWKSDLDGVIGTQPLLDRSLTALGTHAISFRVRDDRGVWSAPVTTTVTVRRPPVLLVHGFCGDNSTWSEAINNDWLGPQWPTSDVVHRTFDPDGNGMTNDSPVDVASLVAAEIQSMKSRFGVRTVNVMTHSMGGLSTRAYIQGPAFLGDVNKLVMLAPPSHGASIVDLLLLTNGYSPEDVELYIPGAHVEEILLSFGVVVDVLAAFNLAPGVVCMAQDSPALHALRPHGDFIHGLNQTRKDDGTEDFGASGEPSDTISHLVEHFMIHGKGLSVSHTHLPTWIKKAIYLATDGDVDLTHMELIWVRKGDYAVTDGSAQLDGVPSSGFDHSHPGLHDSQDSIDQGRLYLLDDPPAPPPGEPGLDQIAGAQLLGAFRGSLVPSTPTVVSVDAAATRLRVGLAWGAGGARFAAAQDKRTVRPVGLVLTSPTGTRYLTSAPVPGFSVDVDGSTLEATLESPAAGSWTIQVVGGAPGLSYTGLAFQESKTFLAIGLSAERVEPGQPVKIAAYLQQDGMGATGATVYAAVSLSQGKAVSLPMIEDQRFPGLYTGSFTPPAEGTYKVLASADLPGAGGSVVTRVGFTSFDAQVLADLSVSATLSDSAPHHGEPVRWTALVRNAGKGSAPATPVQFFDGSPSQGGRLLGTQTIDLPAGPAQVSTSILWLATTGSHRLVVVVDPTNRTGAADVTSHVTEAAVSVADPKPPVARAGADQVAAVGQNVVFDGRASTDDDRIVSYLWKHPAEAGGHPPFSFTLQGPYVALPGGFPSAGVYTVQLVVTDASGNTGVDDLTVRVVEQADVSPPAADAGRNMMTVVGAPVTFDGTRSRDDYGIARATWDVDLSRDSDGDGNPADDQDLAGLTPTLAQGYSRPGVYRARLTVQDAAGNGPATADVLIRVVPSAASQCTLTVPPGAELDRALALAVSGETICLQPARYATHIEMLSPGVTLDGQGALLDGSTVSEPPGVLRVGILVRTPVGAPGVTVRNINVQGFDVGILAEKGSGHQIVDSSVTDGFTGISVLAQESLLARNQVARSLAGYIVGGSANRLVDNSQTGSLVGTFVTGQGQILNGNQSCNNFWADLEATAGSGSGLDNACGIALGWSDQGRRGCTYRCDQIRLPSSGMVISSDALFVAGSYVLEEGPVITGPGVHVHFAGTEIQGPPGFAGPGITLRDAPGASLSGGTITGFSQGLLVAGSDGAQVSGLVIQDAEIGVEVASGANGRLHDVRATAGRLGLRLEAATQGWTIEDGRWTGGEQGGVALAGGGHVLQRNHIDGEVDIQGGSGWRLADNEIVSSHVGVALLSAGTAEIRGNTIHGGTEGVLVHASSGAKVLDNGVTGHRGILLEGGEGHEVSGNHVEATATAVELASTRNGRVLRNTLAAKGGPAVAVSLSTDNEITGNDTRESRGGIELASSDRNRILGNRCAAGLVPDVTLIRSNGNSVSGNALSDVWPTGVLALASTANRIAGNTLQASGASPRDVTASGLSLAARLRGSDTLSATDLATGLALGWESLRSFAGRDRITVATGARFFELLASAATNLQRVAASQGALPEEGALLRLATAQMVRGAELTAQSTIRDARQAGADAATLERAQRIFEQGRGFETAGRPDLAAQAFGRAWEGVASIAASPARVTARMTVAGLRTEGSQVTYTILLTNAGPRAQRDNPGEELVDRLPPELELIDAAASSGQARVDLATGAVTWNGEIPVGGSVTLKIHALVRPGTAGKTVTNQGTVKFDIRGDGLNEAMALTDDPALPGSADATTFVVAAAPSPAAIPTLSTAGWLALIMLLALSALGALRRKTPASREEG